ncbi:unnamed protein product, partial [Prorocentrum cordatum]
MPTLLFFHSGRGQGRAPCKRLKLLRRQQGQQRRCSANVQEARAGAWKGQAPRSQRLAGRCEAEMRQEEKASETGARGEGRRRRRRRRRSGVESLRPSAASSAVPGENQGGGASSASWQRSQPARAPERTGGEGGARGGRKEEAKPRRGTGGRRLLLAGSPTKQKGSGCQRPGIPPLL